MPRRAAAKNHRREVQPDAVYNNRLVTQLINKVLLDGKKATAERIVYGAFDIVAEKSGEDALTVFKKAMDNIRPTLEVKPKRVGGATYQVPMEVNSRRATTLAIRWMVNFSRARKEKTMAERLANEILRRLQRRRRLHQEARGPLQDGRGQPRLLSLPLLVREIEEKPYGKG